MASADIETAAIWEDSDATCLARITLNGANVTQAGLSSISRQVFDLNSSTPTTSISTTTPAIASTIFDTLQTDGRWTKDTTGYNFKDTVAASILTTGGHRYRVEYKLTGASGEAFFVVFEVTTQEVYSS